MTRPGEQPTSALPLGNGVQVVRKDGNGLVALAKPAGVLSHPNKVGEEPRSLLTARYDLPGEYYIWDSPAGTSSRLWLLNRLDSATSGLILAAEVEELALEVRRQFLRKHVRKIYVALVFGAPRQRTELWRDFLAVEKQGARIRTTAHAGNIPAESRMTVVSRVAGPLPVALLQLEPQTGRSHQLRVQCAKRHLPIVGDQTYGDFARNRAFVKAGGDKRLFLHSLESSFDYEYRGRQYTFAAQAPLPREFDVTR